MFSNFMVNFAFLCFNYISKMAKIYSDRVSKFCTVTEKNSRKIQKTVNCRHQTVLMTVITMGLFHGVCTLWVA